MSLQVFNSRETKRENWKQAQLQREKFAYKATVLIYIYCAAYNYVL